MVCKIVMCASSFAMLALCAIGVVEGSAHRADCTDGNCTFKTWSLLQHSGRVAASFKDVSTENGSQHPEGVGETENSFQDKVFDSLDIDGDGAIQRNEFNMITGLTWNQPSTGGGGGSGSGSNNNDDNGNGGEGDGSGTCSSCIPEGWDPAMSGPGSANCVVVAGGNQAQDGLAWPSCAVVNDDDTIYVGDFSDNRVSLWDPSKCTEGSCSDAVIVVGQNGVGSNLQTIKQPYGLAKDSQNRLLISEFGNNRVTAWGPDDWTSGSVVAGGNGAGARLDQLDCPTGIFVDASDNVYVGEWKNKRITRWDLGATQGVLVAAAPGIITAVWVNPGGQIFSAWHNGAESTMTLSRWEPGDPTTMTFLANSNAVNCVDEWCAHQNQVNYGIDSLVGGEAGVFMMGSRDGRLLRVDPGSTNPTVIYERQDPHSHSQGDIVFAHGHTYYVESEHFRVLRC